MTWTGETKESPRLLLLAPLKIEKGYVIMDEHVSQVGSRDMINLAEGGSTDKKNAFGKANVKTQML